MNKTQKVYVVQIVTYTWHRFYEIVGATTDYETAHKLAADHAQGRPVTEDAESSFSRREYGSHVLIEAFEDFTPMEHRV